MKLSSWICFAVLIVSFFKLVVHFLHKSNRNFSLELKLILPLLSHFLVFLECMSGEWIVQHIPTDELFCTIHSETYLQLNFEKYWKIIIFLIFIKFRIIIYLKKFFFSFHHSNVLFCHLTKAEVTILFHCNSRTVNFTVVFSTTSQEKIIHYQILTSSLFFALYELCH